MTLLRIVTGLSEYPTELVRDLRSRGFEVETCVIHKEHHDSVDLELTIEQCSAANIAESVADALAENDVVVLANANANPGKIRSIGMVLLNSSDDAQMARTTVLPPQFNEIYTALLRERAPKSSVHAIPANLSLAWQKTLVAGSRTISGASTWARSRKWNWNAWTSVRQPEPEPDLVPSMFSLSGDLAESSQTIEEQTQGSPAPVRRKGILGFWKPIGVGALAVLAATLWLHGFSRSDLNASQASDASQKDATIQTQTVPAASTVMPKSVGGAVSAHRVAVKSHANDNDDFQDVVVRHFPQTPANKDVVKRRIVVD